jgi:hypothetical protein
MPPAPMRAARRYGPIRRPSNADDSPAAIAEVSASGAGWGESFAIVMHRRFYSCRPSAQPRAPFCREAFNEIVCVCVLSRRETGLLAERHQYLRTALPRRIPIRETKNRTNPLYLLFCTCTRAFSPISRIERFRIRVSH